MSDPVGSHESECSYLCSGLVQTWRSSKSWRVQVLPSSSRVLLTSEIYIPLIPVSPSPSLPIKLKYVSSFC